jgi:hypothetical protein
MTMKNDRLSEEMAGSNLTSIDLRHEGKYGKVLFRIIPNLLRGSG